MTSQPSATAPDAPSEPQEARQGPFGVMLASQDLEALNGHLESLGHVLAGGVVVAMLGPIQQRDAARDLAAHWEGQADHLERALNGLLEALTEAGWSPTWAKHTAALTEAYQAVLDVHRANTGREDVPLRAS